MYLVVYNRNRAIELLRTTSPEQLRSALRQGRIGSSLTAAERGELDAILLAWEQRALGAMSLRDTLLIDTERGPRAYGLLCADLSIERAPLPPTPIGRRALPSGDLVALPADLAVDPALQAIAQTGQRNGLAMAIQRHPTDFPLPPNLEALLPPDPPPFNPALFDPPRGWRRTLAALLAVCGTMLLTLPILLGRMPEHPAGAPLALITLALLVGIRAGRAGYLGSLCIWMVAQLPSFRHDTTASLLWPALPLLAAGVLLLSVDRRIRAMWTWIRRQLFGGAPSSNTHQ